MILYFRIACIIAIFSSVYSVEFIQISESPRIYLCEHFISEEECDSLKTAAKSSLTRSTVVDDGSASIGVVDARRSSYGTFIAKRREPKAATRVRSLAKEVTGIPIENGEDLQILRYEVGAEYQPHFDYFDTKTVGGAFHHQWGGQRLATLIVYLHTTELGGETVFPTAGIKIKPIKGAAVLFYNTDGLGNPDPRSFHGGAPVIAGEKWIATLWMRQGKFR